MSAPQPTIRKLPATGAQGGGDGVSSRGCGGLSQIVPVGNHEEEVVGSRQVKVVEGHRE